MKAKYKVVVTFLNNGCHVKEYKFDTLKHAEMRVNDLTIIFAREYPECKVVTDLLSKTMYRNQNDVMFSEKYEIQEIN